MHLGGRPLLLWARDVLLEVCDVVVLVVPPGFMEAAQAMHEGTAGVELVAGGETRQHSVRNGLSRVSSELVAVHDGARPFATAELLRSVIDAVREADAAVPVLPVDDTIKRVAGDAVVETVDRRGLFRAQTPQVFRTDVLRRAHEAAEADGFIATDDAQLVEHYGGRVVAVPGSWSNIKITRADDLPLAEAMLQR